MQLAAILPHTRLYGGVKRYLELGRRFIRAGDTFTIFTPDGARPTWSQFSGGIRPLRELPDASPDVILTSEECFLPELRSSPAALKIFYVINKNKALRRIVQEQDIIVLANSTDTFQRVRRITGVVPMRAFGGVNLQPEWPSTDRATPQRVLTVLTYGRLSHKVKGTAIVVRACERLRDRGVDVRLLLFDSPVDAAARELIRGFTTSVPFEFIVDHPVDRMEEVYRRADIFAIAERKAGWSNTCAEAMSFGVPIVATAAGTKDFLRDGDTGVVVRRNVTAMMHALEYLASSVELRQRFAQRGRDAIQEFSWDRLAEQIRSFAEDWLALRPRLADRSDGAHRWKRPISTARSAASVVNGGWPFAPRLVASAKVGRKWPATSSPRLLDGVYILCYHSIVDPSDSHEWERAYSRASTSLAHFREHIGYLCDHATPVPLSRVPQLFESGPINKPYFAITFDDGYSNVLINAAPVLRANSIVPTAFVNIPSTSGNSVYYSVLAALLASRGRLSVLAESYHRHMGHPIPWHSDVVRHLKRTYSYGVTESIVFDAWSRCFLGPQPERVHLSLGDLRHLAADGWEIANHTRSHATLSALTGEEQARQIEDWEQYVKTSGLPHIRWLGYPNGGPSHVNNATRQWMRRHPDWNGAFCGGGVNLLPSRSEWLRIGIADSDLPAFVRTIAESGERMAWVCQAKDLTQLRSAGTTN